MAKQHSDITQAHAASPAARMGKQRGALIVYRYQNGQPCFLLISSARDPQRLTLPGGKARKHESTLNAATRETLEESGVYTAPRAYRNGRYLHRKQGQRVHPTDTYLAYYAGRVSERESREIYWLTWDEIQSGRFNIKKTIRKQLRLAALELSKRPAAAA